MDRANCINGVPTPVGSKRECPVPNGVVQVPFSVGVQRLKAGLQVSPDIRKAVRQSCYERFLPIVL